MNFELAGNTDALAAGMLAAGALMFVPIVATRHVDDDGKPALPAVPPSPIFQRSSSSRQM